MFNRPTDLNYRRFLRRLHRNVLFDWYLEIGSRTGDSVEAVRGKTICVDPFFQIERNVVGEKPIFMAFQQTSDQFYADGTLANLGIEISFGFLDGMHLIEYLLRDFINTERHMAPAGVIAIHDCCPYDFAMTTRDVANAPQRAWTGDVWKIIPILKVHRPDLQITVLGCRPTGLVLVHGLNPSDTTLADNYERIVAGWRDVDLESYGADKFFDSYRHTPVSDVEQNKFAIFDGVRLDDADQATPRFVSP